MAVGGCSLGRDCLPVRKLKYIAVHEEREFDRQRGANRCCEGSRFARLSARGDRRLKISRVGARLGCFTARVELFGIVMHGLKVVAACSSELLGCAHRGNRGCPEIRSE